jgi:shikimate kinase
MTNGIIVFGANGSGKSTIGRELARVLNYKYMDHENYAFAKSDIPYTVERSREECFRLMLADINEYGSFVLCAVTGDFCEQISSMYRFAVYLSAPHEIRVERIKRRAVERYGDRVLEGGDMYERQMAFLDFASKRPLTRIEQWAKTLICPVMQVDSTRPVFENVELIAEEYLRKMPDEKSKF